MNWEKSKIEELLYNMSDKINNTKSKKELETLKFDYFSLLELLKTYEIEDYQIIINREDFKQLKFSDLKDLYEDFYKDSFECLKINQELLFKVINFIDTTILPSPRMSFNKRISVEVYLKMVAEFFSHYDEEHYKIFKSLVNGNIQFAKSDIEIGDNAKGKCYHLLSTEDTFIITNFKDKKNISVLPHEIAHAYELAQLKNLIHRSCWHFSSFTESYAKFMELAFLDYYKNSEYKNYFLKSKYQLLDSLKLSSEYALSFVGLLKDDTSIDFTKEKRKYRLAKKYIDYVLSDMFAIYLFNLYKNNREYFDVIIKKFHSYEGKSDELIWHLFTEEDLINSFKEELNTFSKQIVLSRKRN